MKDGQNLADYLVKIGVLKSPALIQAFQAIDRKDFIPENRFDEAYDDYPISIGYEQTISQPYTVAFMLELLDPKPGMKVLDVGSGSGWTTALLAHIVSTKGEVIGRERIPELVKLGQQNLGKYHFPWATIREAGKALGAPDHAPFDRILVSAAASQLIDQLIDQLAAPGKLVIPVKSAILLIEKQSDGSSEQQKYEGFAFVPLITE